MELISERGIQSLTIKNISKKVGISEPAIYRHFDSKTEILLAILDLFIENNKQIFKSEVVEKADIKEIIDGLFYKFVDTFLSHPHLISVVFSEEIFRNDTIFRKKTKSIIDGNYSILISLINKAQEKGQVVNDLDPKAMTTLILGSLRLCVKRWQMDNYEFDLKKETDKLKKTILNILLKK